MKTVAIVSGGMDSVTLAHLLASEGDEVVLVSFDYGQKHRKELEFAALCGARLGAQHEIVDLTSLTRLLGSSSLVSETVAVPDGHYAEENMKSTVVPNRNAMMISIAGAIAVAQDADRVAIGVHGGDHFIYPDCRPDFVASANTTLQLGNAGMVSDGFGLVAPFSSGSKTDIARIGNELGVPWLETWSCYNGADVHCGSCGTCFERREAFSEATVYDPTPYKTKPSFPDPRP